MDNSDFESQRETLVNLFSQKSNSHIGYLLAFTIAVIGTISTDVLETLHFNIIILFLVALVFAIYFFLRALFYSHLVESVTVVKPYNLDDLLKLNNSEDKKELYLQIYDISSIYFIKKAALDLTIREGKYKNTELPIERNISFDRFLYHHRTYFLIPISALIIINYALYFMGYLK